MPRLIGRETFGVLSLSALLVLRTVLSIYISEVNGSIVKAIVDVKPIKFIEQVKLVYVDYYSRYIFIPICCRQ